MQINTVWNVRLCYWDFVWICRTQNAIRREASDRIQNRAVEAPHMQRYAVFGWQTTNVFDSRVLLTSQTLWDFEICAVDELTKYETEQITASTDDAPHRSSTTYCWEAH